MNKYLLSIATIAIALSVFTACDKDSTEGVTFIEDYPVFYDNNSVPLDGTEVFLTLGESYNSSYTAKIGDEDWTAKSTMSITNVSGDVVDNITTETPGLFYIYYTAPSKNNLSSWTAKRTIFVYDPSVTESIAGKYVVDLKQSYRFYLPEQTQKSFSDEASTQGYNDEAVVTFTELCPGFYKCNDILFGWYDLFRGYNKEYPNTFNMVAYICLNSDNTLTLLSSSYGYPAWFTGADGMEGTYDSRNKTLNITTKVPDYNFVVTLISK